MQRAVNTTKEDEAFSMWFAYIHCGATDVLSMGLPRDYISSLVVNQNLTVTLANDRPVLSSERAPDIKKPVTVRSGHKPQMGALFQDRLAD
jgi:hypothetical protein